LVLEQEALKTRFSETVYTGYCRMADATTHRDPTTHPLLQQIMSRYAIHSYLRDSYLFASMQGGSVETVASEKLQAFIVDPQGMEGPLVVDLAKTQLQNRRKWEEAQKKIAQASETTRKLWEDGYVTINGITIRLDDEITGHKDYRKARTVVLATLGGAYRHNPSTVLLGGGMGAVFYEDARQQVAVFIFAGTKIKSGGNALWPVPVLQYTLKLGEDAREFWDRIDRFDVVFNTFGAGLDLGVRVHPAWQVSLRCFVSWLTHGVPFGQLEVSKRLMENLSLDTPEKRLALFQGYGVICQSVPEIEQRFPRIALQIKATQELWALYGTRHGVPLNEQELDLIRISLYQRALTDTITHYVSRQGYQDLEEEFNDDSGLIAKSGIGGMIQGVSVGYGPPIGGSQASGFGVGLKLKIQDKLLHYVQTDVLDFIGSVNEHFAQANRILEQGVTVKKHAVQRFAWEELFAGTDKIRVHYDAQSKVCWLIPQRDGKLVISSDVANIRMFYYEKPDGGYQVGFANTRKGGQKSATKFVYSICADESPSEPGAFYGLLEFTEWGSPARTLAKTMEKGVVVFNIKGKKVETIVFNRYRDWRKGEEWENTPIGGDGFDFPLYHLRQKVWVKDLQPEFFSGETKHCNQLVAVFALPQVERIVNFLTVGFGLYWSEHRSSHTGGTPGGDGGSNLPGVPGGGGGTGGSPFPIRSLGGSGGGTGE
jgi:hypothetical protein